MVLNTKLNSTPITYPHCLIRLFCSTFNLTSIEKVCQSHIFLMSFLPSNNHALAIDLWPTPYNSIIEKRADVSNLQQWQCFPLNIERMVEWATVIKIPTSIPTDPRNRLLVYKTLPDSDPTSAYYPISVRLFGFLEDFYLGEYGGWQGYVGSHFLSLHQFIVSSIAIQPVPCMQFNHSL